MKYFISYTYMVLKATLEYRKHFVSAFHNAVELFMKQQMKNFRGCRELSISRQPRNCSIKQVWIMEFSGNVKGKWFALKRFGFSCRDKCYHNFCP